MYNMSLVHLRIKPGQTCQHMHTANPTKPLMQHSFEEFSEKQRRVELKSVGNFVAKGPVNNYQCMGPVQSVFHGTKKVLVPWLCFRINVDVPCPKALKKVDVPWICF